MPAAVTAPLLVFGYGNPSRGDDALGPRFVAAVEALGMPGVDCLTDFQLQVEHALDLVGRQRVLFVDASAALAEPFRLSPLAPLRDASFTSHAISPAAVLQAYVQIGEGAPPPCELLALRGTAFELGAALSVPAEKALAAALDWVQAVYLAAAAR